MSISWTENCILEIFHTSSDASPLGGRARAPIRLDMSRWKPLNLRQQHLLHDCKQIIKIHGKVASFNEDDVAAARHMNP